MAEAEAEPVIIGGMVLDIQATSSIPPHPGSTCPGKVTYHLPLLFSICNSLCANSSIFFKKKEPKPIWELLIFFYFMDQIYVFEEKRGTFVNQYSFYMILQLALGAFPLGYCEFCCYLLELQLGSLMLSDNSGVLRPRRGCKECC